MNRLISILIVLIYLSLPTAAQVVRSVTLDQAIELGMANSKLLDIDQARTNISAAKYKQQKYAVLPATNWSTTYNRLSSNIDVFKFPVAQNQYQTVGATIYDQFYNKLSLSQVIFAGLRGWNILQNTKLQSQATDADAQKDRVEVRNAIVTAYYNHYKLGKSLEIVQENIALSKGRLRDIENLKGAGMALRNDVLKVELALNTLEQTQAEVQSSIAVSSYNMAVMLGLPDSVQIVCSEAGLYQSKPAVDKQSYLSTSLVQRADLKAADYRIRGAERMLKSSKGAYSPIISAGFNFYYSRPNQRVFVEDIIRFHNSWDIGVTLSWNLTSLFTTQFQTREAKANLKMVETQQKQLNDNVRMEVNSNYMAYKLAIDKIAMQEKAAAQAKENQSLTKNQYDAGLKTITDLLEADNLAAQSEINLTNSKIDAENAYARLLKSTGN